jgi:hypothetical protein
MPKRTQPYVYREGDDPVALASQYGVTPGELLRMNPGGTPFSVGQNINVPFAYDVNQQQTAVQQANTWKPPTVYGASNTVSNNFLGGLGNVPENPLINAGVPPTVAAGRFEDGSLKPSSAYGTDDSWYRTTAQTQAARQAELRIQNGTMNPPTAGTLAQGDFYGYERDPETGRSVRVVKNAATSSFLKELRWDPQRKKYVSIGTLLKQGKLDLKGNWRKKSNRQRQTDSHSNKPPQQTQQDFTLSNSLISFNASSG